MSEVSPANQNKNSPESPQGALVQASLVIYGVMAAIGLGVSHYVHHNLTSNFAWPPEALGWQSVLAFTALGTGVLLILSYFFEEYVPSFRALKQAFSDILGRSPAWVAFYLSGVSAFGEEILFRGAIQPGLGLAFTSILFGLLHIGPTGRISSWSVWAVLAGLLLGWMYEETGSLWPPILCHFLVNFISMLRLRSAHTQRQYEAGSP